MSALPPHVTTLLLGTMTLLTDAQWVRLVQITRQNVSTFRGYHSVTILPFNVPEQTLLVRFTFIASEKQVRGIDHCLPRRVSIAIKPGSVPVLSPDGSTFPEHYLVRRQPLYEAELLSDDSPVAVNVSRPVSGEWFAVVFLSYTDPADDHVVQRGLASSCSAGVVATAEALVTWDVKVLAPGQRLGRREQSKKSRKYYKCFVPPFTQRTVVNVTVDDCNGDCPSFDIATDTRKFPNVENNSERNPMHVHCHSEKISKGDDCLLVFTPSEDTWHYFTVASVASNTSRDDGRDMSYSIAVTLDNDAEYFWPRLNLTRQSLSGFFLFSYFHTFDKYKQKSGIPIGPNNNMIEVSSVNIITAEPTFMSFEVFSLRDIGGTISFLLQLNVDHNVAVAKRFHVSVVSCVSYSSRSLPQFPNKCISSSGGESVASVHVNSTAESNLVGRIHLPFPESGQWFVSLQPFCLVGPSADPEYTRVDCKEVKEIRVSFMIYSEACGPKICGPYGYCAIYSSNGIIFSNCLCKYGYRGWECNDGSQRNMTELLIATLLLTLSNLLFLPAVVISLRRRYWTEALVYACTMFFSTFYHACDSGGGTYSFCLLSSRILHYCDFFAAVMALWVTLVAMAGLPAEVRSLVLVTGTMGISLGVVHDHESEAVFTVPLVVGVFLVCVRWGGHCRNRKACYPRRGYWWYFFPPAVLLIVTGFCCFSFLQTRGNYKYVHSVWHVLIAAAIALILPMEKYTTLDETHLEYSNSEHAISNE